MRAKAQGQLTACKSNLKNLGTALEMYASDDPRRHYPGSSQVLTPRYLKTIPTCPAASTVSYVLELDPSGYTLVCSGHHHEGAGIRAPNHPQYSSLRGLVERPQGGP